MLQFLAKLNDKEYIGVRPDLCLSGSGDYPAPDCRFYVRCVGLVAYVSRCPGGFLFNAADKRCDWPNKSPKCLKTCIDNGNYVSEDPETTPVPSKYYNATGKLLANSAIKPVRSSTKAPSINACRACVVPIYLAPCIATEVPRCQYGKAIVSVVRLLKPDPGAVRGVSHKRTKTNGPPHNL